jgi:NADH dehydrogenase
MTEITDNLELSSKRLKIAITGGTGFVGSALARHLVADGHRVVLISRCVISRCAPRCAAENRLKPEYQTPRPHSQILKNTRGSSAGSFEVCPVGMDDPARLCDAFAGCDAVAHLAGINRQRGTQTYQRVHVEGTANVVVAAKRAGVRRIAMLSFLRARPNCGSAYHESKWAAEEIVRNSGIPFTILKSGVIFGRGDHLLDHLSHALHTLPLFATVGLRQPPLRPIAVRDVAEILRAALVEERLTNQTVAVLGPETLTMRQLVKRVANACGRNAILFPMPVAFHRLLGVLGEAMMKVPLVSRAQVRMLAEGLCEPAPLPIDGLPQDLAPTTPFSIDEIQRGLPEPGPFRCSDFAGFTEATS